MNFQTMAKFCPRSCWMPPNYAWCYLEHSNKGCCWTLPLQCRWKILKPGNATLKPKLTLAHFDKILVGFQVTCCLQVTNYCTDAQWSLFSMIFQNFGPIGQISKIILGVLVAFLAQTISIHFGTVSPFQLFFPQITKIWSKWAQILNILIPRKCPHKTSFQQTVQPTAPFPLTLWTHAPRVPTELHQVQKKKHFL